MNPLLVFPRPILYKQEECGARKMRRGQGVEKPNPENKARAPQEAPKPLIHPIPINLLAPIHCPTRSDRAPSHHLMRTALKAVLAPFAGKSLKRSIIRTSLRKPQRRMIGLAPGRFLYWHLDSKWLRISATRW
jgi:hypothetical protein